MQPPGAFKRRRKPEISTGRPQLITTPRHHSRPQDATEAPAKDGRGGHNNSETDMETQYQPRYQAFFDAHGKRPNWQFLDFIQAMKRAYQIENGQRVDYLDAIDNHDRFTAFIQAHATEWSAPA